MKRSSKALRMARPLAVVAVWAGLLGYVIPAAFSTAPTVSSTASSAASGAGAGSHGSGAGSQSARSARSGSQQLGPAPGRQPRQPDLAMVRVMQASMRPHRVTVTLGRQDLSRDQAFASITPYRSVRPGTWIVRASSAREHATTRVRLAAGSRTTLVVLDGRGSLVISAPDVPPGKAVAASGALRTGGSPPKPGRSPVPWLVLCGTGLLLVLAGLTRLRQLRWARRVVARIR